MELVGVPSEWAGTCKVPAKTTMDRSKMEVSSEPDRSNSTWIQMPDLSHLTSDLAARRSLRFLGSSKPHRDQPFRDLANTLSRLVDQAIDEYKHARTTLTVFLNPTVLDPASYWHSITHVETCITALHRILGLVKKLRSLRNVLPDGSLLIPRSRNSEVTAGRVEDRIRLLRNAFQHIEGDIVKNASDRSSAVPVVFHNELFDLCGMVVGYAELAKWIEQLHELTTLINAYQQPLILPGQ